MKVFFGFVAGVLFMGLLLAALIGGYITGEVCSIKTYAVTNSTNPQLAVPRNTFVLWASTNHRSTMTKVDKASRCIETTSIPLPPGTYVRLLDRTKSDFPVTVYYNPPLPTPIQPLNREPADVDKY